jgi:hypothetical protein
LPPPELGRSRELDDLRSPADNEAAADFLLEQVRTIVENPDTRLVASLAGGRKTMGAILYAALTLVAREDDRITHVLVKEPFETLREFWYPAQHNLGDWRYAPSLRAVWDEQEIRKAVSSIRTKLHRYGRTVGPLALCLPEKGRCSLDVPGALIHIQG